MDYRCPITGQLFDISDEEYIRIMEEGYFDDPRTYKRITKEKSPTIEKVKNDAEIRAELFNRIANTDDGEQLFRYLVSQCGFKDTTISVLPNGQFSHDNIIWEESRRKLWVELRRNLSLQNRNKIEKDLD